MLLFRLRCCIAGDCNPSTMETFFSRYFLFHPHRCERSSRGSCYWAFIKEPRLSYTYQVPTVPFTATQGFLAYGSSNKGKYTNLNILNVL